MAVTMSDVARAAGVSPMTVSNVINGHPQVRAETRLRVLRSISDLGYQVNLAARHLRAGRTGAIGLVVPELDRPYFGQLASRLADAVERSGRHLMLERTGASREGELAAVSFARLRMYDGVVLSVVGLEPSDLEQVTIATPTVLIGEREVPRTYDHVMMDNVGGAELATSHLIATGARRIALLGGRRPDDDVDMPSSRSRGYRRAHEAAGTPVDERLVVGVDAFTLAGGRDAVLRLADDGIAFDAVFALTDVAAMGALRALADLGRDVPGEVQVVGFDDIAECEYLVPRLTSVDPGNTALAQAVLDLLDRRIGAPDGATVEPVARVMPARLVERASTRPLTR